MSICSRRRTISKVSPRSNPIWRRFEMNRADDILDTIASRKTSGESFVLATVVRTVAATAAKAGAKAVILPDGTISQGWIGGGCGRAAVLKGAPGARARPARGAAGARGAPPRAGRRGRATGGARRPPKMRRLVSVAPEDV